jgi:hypothetical protein
MVFNALLVNVEAGSCELRAAVEDIVTECGIKGMKSSRTVYL